MALEEEPVFKALADPTRRLLLDRLFSRDGRSLSDLATDLEMTRFGVMKHLQILEQASLVVTRKSGREKLHFLNVVPIREIYVRWIGKYTEHHAAALVDLKSRLEENAVTESTLTPVATQVFRIHIKATPEAVWEAITSAEWTAQYGFHIARPLRIAGRRHLPGIGQRGHESHGCAGCRGGGRRLGRRTAATTRPNLAHALRARAGGRATDDGDVGDRTAGGRRHPADRDS